MGLRYSAMYLAHYYAHQGDLKRSDNVYQYILTEIDRNNRRAENAMTESFLRDLEHPVT